MQSSLEHKVSPAAAVNEEAMPAHQRGLIVGLVAVLLVAPFLVYPIFAMKVLCFALFASAFNLLLGYVGLLSFGHAAFFGMATPRPMPPRSGA
jgi:branched-chain amino acid transport system permease protein